MAVGSGILNFFGERCKGLDKGEFYKLIGQAGGEPIFGPFWGFHLGNHYPSGLKLYLLSQRIGETTLNFEYNVLTQKENRPILKHIDPSEVSVEHTNNAKAYLFRLNEILPCSGTETIDRKEKIALELKPEQLESEKNKEETPKKSYSIFRRVDNLLQRKKVELPPEKVKEIKKAESTKKLPEKPVPKQNVVKYARHKGSVDETIEKYTARGDMVGLCGELRINYSTLRHYTLLSFDAVSKGISDGSELIVLGEKDGIYLKILEKNFRTMFSRLSIDAPPDLNAKYSKDVKDDGTPISILRFTRAQNIKKS